MNFTQAYRGTSGVRGTGNNLSLSFSPNLRRDQVVFLGELKTPLRFREAISALHGVVVNDLKFKPRDKTAYQAYLEQVRQRESAIREAARSQTKRELLAQVVEPISPALETRFKILRDEYWSARQRYSNELAKHDPELFRALVPCDPVITVAPDSLLFECFSKDESSYGCLTVDRDAFHVRQPTCLGTTNVDYSLALFEEFQRLRTYRRTAFAIDPTGLDVSTQGEANYREEKIDLPPSWLQGFMRLQASMSLPMRKVSISREALYNLLAYLKKHRAKQSPRAIRFEMHPGSPVEMVLEPWEVRIKAHDCIYDGPKEESIRIWGRDRLLTLARLLPIAEGADVYLLGTGLPSFWNVRLGEMRFLLGLSGWTANDWTGGGGSLADLAPPVQVTDDVLGDIGAAFRESPTRTFEQIRRHTNAAPQVVAAGLNRFALMGQVIHDLAGGVYRWRQILPITASMAQMTGESEEAKAARELISRGKVSLKQDDRVAGRRTLTGRIENREVEVLIDADERIVRGQCNCSHHFRYKLRSGPCRHMQALRRVADGEQQPGTLEQWYRSFRGDW